MFTDSASFPPNLGRCDWNVGVESHVEGPVRKYLYSEFIWIFVSPNNNYTFNCTAGPLLVHTVHATAEVFVTLGKERFSSPLTPVSALCYQPPCHSFVPMAAVFKFVAAEVFLQWWTQTVARRRINNGHDQRRVCFYKVIRNVSLFSDRLHYITRCHCVPILSVELEIFWQVIYWIIRQTQLKYIYIEC